MDIDIWYWITEYGKVFCGYLFLMFLWPSVVFHGYLRNKSKTFRFSFCIAASITIMNTMVLGLGLIRGLNQWVVCLFIYGVLGLAFFRNVIAYFDREYKRMMEAKFPDVRSLKGKYRKLVLVSLFFLVLYKYVKKAVQFLSFDYLRKIKSCNWTKVRLRVKESIWNFGRRISSLFWRYGVLMLVIIYGMIYFSYGAFQVYSYGYGDLYTHHKWVYGLVEGNIFPDGVYPEAMHCFIYCMHVLFGIKVHSILLYLQVIHVGVFLLAAYLLLRKIFHWRYTSILVLMLFLTLNLTNADLIHSMFRLQITMPMEFGLPAVCLCALYLVNYLSSKHTERVTKKGKVLRYFWDENLLMFLLSLAVVVMVHFHTAVMALFIGGSFALFEIKKIINRKYLIPLLTAAFCAGMIATTPMMGALAQGMPFNTSIDWAVNAMSGYESRDYREQMEKTDKEEIRDTRFNGSSFKDKILYGVTGIYDKGYAALYGKVRGSWMLALTLIGAAFCCLVRINKKFEKYYEASKGYPPAIFASVIYIMVYAAPMIGLPDLIPEGRFFAPGHMMLLAVLAMPVDLIFSILLDLCSDLILRVLSLVSIAGIYGGMIATGNFRGFLFYELSQYNTTAMVTESIVNTFPWYSYTIVSPTDELYPVIQYGWHEELLSFVENCNKGTYSIPTEYVFIYVEKKPLLYAQSHFFQGSSWLGEEKYLEPFWNMYSLKYPDSGASQAPEVIAAQVSVEEADKEIPAYESAWSMYLKLENRTVLESKAYEWCRQFAQEHPAVLNVYYEDDEFVCYYFRQDMGSPAYELGVGQ